MESRPKIQLQLTTADRFVESLGWASLISLWAFILLNYSSLPETIATHFNISGQPDKYGSKGSILILPIIATVMFIGLTVLNRYPQIFNFPTALTAENAGRQYVNATRLIRYLKSVLVLVFGFIAYATMQTTDSHIQGIGVWFFPIMLVLIFALLGVFVFRAVKMK